MTTQKYKFLLLDRATLGRTRAAEQEIDALGAEEWLERQLDPDSLDDGPLEEFLHETFPSLSMEPWEMIETYQEDPFVPARELVTASMYRAAFSPRQLFERMVIFWSDHFSIDLFSGFLKNLKPVDDRAVIRPHAFGKFFHLLRGSAYSPAMVVYLDNNSNEKGRPNENYARELLELHTLGVDDGYTQQDVREVARIFTGWRVKGDVAGRGVGTFRFSARNHDTGSKVVLGREFPPQGNLEGEALLHLLARQPQTAKRISRKMLNYFWGYDPPESLVEEIAAVYLDTDGDIREILRAILHPDRLLSATPKFKRPFHLLISAIRTLEAEIEDPEVLHGLLHEAGHLPFAWQPPNGYPDHPEHWTGYMLARWNLAATFFQGGIRPNFDAYDPALNPQMTRKDLRKKIIQAFGNTFELPTRRVLRDFLEARPLDREAVSEALALAVSAPEYQRY